MATRRPVAVVTGASSGIGRACSLALVDAGFHVVGTCCDAAHAGPPDGVDLLDLDVAGDAAVTSAVQQVVDRWGRIDVLVNSAGIGPARVAHRDPGTRAQGDFDSSLLGLIRMTQAVLPHMRARGNGRIINLPSISGLITGPYLAAHVASKHAVEGYSEAVDHDAREHGVRVLLVEPGGTGADSGAARARPAAPLQGYDKQRRIAEQVTAALVPDGDASSTVAKAVVAAATDVDPKPRYVAALPVGRISVLRSAVPEQMFYGSIRTYNQLPAQPDQRASGHQRSNE
ncbi:SDR family NAD(P)-dependent oxidoreductase [Promicromonospora panici]|uniref:SDR family NAD(P)-dependent oxidoreductase n=1 Tax=Promicromonospora panici TaxID=2219658 RepID=UPI00101DDF71|nr:SDR family NAD(P)-dependent oxidoreductase [Promicromonospora panici]